MTRKVVFKTLVSGDQEHTVYASRDDFEALKEVSDALRAQISCPSSQHSSQMQDMDQKMSAVVARLDSLTRSQRRHSSLLPL